MPYQGSFWLAERSWVARSAAIALGAIGNLRAVAPLIEALSDPVPYVWCEAAAALGQFAPAISQQAVEPMLQALQDQDSVVVGVAAAHDTNPSCTSSLVPRKSQELQSL